jgi:hypothetical protein
MIKAETWVHGVTIKFQNSDHKNYTKKGEIYLLIPQLNIVPARFGTTFTTFIT